MMNMPRHSLLSSQHPSSKVLVNPQQRPMTPVQAYSNFQPIPMGGFPYMQPSNFLRQKAEGVPSNRSMSPQYITPMQLPTQMQNKERVKTVLSTQQSSPKQVNVEVSGGLTIHGLERQMMFINEPSIQQRSSCNEGEFMKHLYKVHQRCMAFHNHPNSPDRSNILPLSDHQQKQSGFSELYPRDYSRFKDSIHTKLLSFDETLQQLRQSLLSSDKQVSDILSKLDQDRDQLKLLLTDVTQIFQFFTQRVLEIQSHHDKVIKTKELMEKELKMESSAIKSQKLQLVRIIEDLTVQLKQTRVERQELAHANDLVIRHQQVKKELEITQMELGVQKKIAEEQEQQIRRVNETNMLYRAENEKLKEVVTDLDEQVQKKDFQLFNVIQENGELSEKLREYVSRFESGESAKDKIIAKLKQQIRGAALQEESN
ncbi:hypothetical protein FGO68_gene12680 [Halteria grandinella]|uniref:Uncharacterized protein n=1 Tax=Halteria grandinella TaxID=5974 RepID=A0A8J8T8H7_HALGN|nr:hypothetical protein FGO68_gene12680 [Halteria grandinella]